ncbi:MAG: C25 family cysteine peptidase, partial [candidate division WOR-3 bacterium]
MDYFLLIAILSSRPVAVLVYEPVYDSIASELDTFREDLDDDGYQGVVFRVDAGATPESVRNLLMNLYQSIGIEGAILVGKIPWAWFHTWYFGTYACDLFYMDLNGTWLNSDGDSAYDFHIDPDGPEIWVGRLACWSLTFGGVREVDLLREYFRRNHAYRKKLTNPIQRSLLYSDEEFGLYASILREQTRELVWNLDFRCDTNTNADDYANTIAQEYECAMVIAHSTYRDHIFDLDTYWMTHFWNYQIPQVDPQIFFYYFFACDVGDYTVNNGDYMAGWYVFNPEGQGLAATASAAPGSPLYFSVFQDTLAAYGNLGEAFKKYMAEVGYKDPENFYQTVLLGDPTLRLRREMARREVLFYDQAGDLDLTPDPGETLQVYVKLRNQTENQTITGITAKLSCGNGLITVLDSIAFYGDFAPGGERINSTPFRIAISPSAQRGLRIPIDMRISSTDGREWLTGFYLNIEKPYLTYFWQMWDDPDGNLDPGETSPLYVQILYDTLWASGDTGKAGACASNVRGILRSLDTAITVIDSIANYGIVSWGARAWPTDPFRLRASSGITQSPYP